MSVKRILREAGIYPEPEKAKKRPPVPWSQFVHAHLDTMVACDFFTKPVWTLRGKFEAHVLVFIHLGSRKVFASAPTLHPTHEWVQRQTRNANIWLDEIGVRPRFLIRDGDKKFPGEWLKDSWASG